MRMGPSMAWLCPLQPAQNDRAFHRPRSERVLLSRSLCGFQRQRKPRIVRSVVEEVFDIAVARYIGRNQSRTGSRSTLQLHH